MNKLEILQQFKKKYGDMINPDLISIKYCQNEKDAFVEMSFLNIPYPTIINLDFISDDSEQANLITYQYIPPLFNPKSDIVDNATCLIEFEPYSLLCCIDHLFVQKAMKEIDLQYNPYYQRNLK
jgi:hypothetical protein